MRGWTSGISVSVLAAFELELLLVTELRSGSNSIRLYAFSSGIQDVNCQAKGRSIATSRPSISGALTRCRNGIEGSEFADLVATLVKICGVVSCANSAHIHQLRPASSRCVLRRVHCTLCQRYLFSIPLYRLMKAEAPRSCRSLLPSASLVFLPLLRRRSWSPRWLRGALRDLLLLHPKLPPSL